MGRPLGRAYKKTPPPATPDPREQTCRCGAFRAEVLLPEGAGAIALCWICSHDHVEHGRGAGESGTPCDCSPEEVYPDWVLARRREALGQSSTAGKSDSSTISTAPPRLN